MKMNDNIVNKAELGSTNVSLEELYLDHISLQQDLVEKLCQRCSLEYLLIASGTITYHFKDDREYPFKVNPYFKQWLPLTESPGSYILLRPEELPILFLNKPDDFWLVWPGLESCEWDAKAAIRSAFKVIEIKHPSDITVHLPGKATRRGNGAFIGFTGCLHSDWTIGRVNDETILNFLNYHRGYKTPYEVHCLYQANVMARPGHKQAETLFLEGATEINVFLAYISAIKTVQQDDPYEPIVAYNEHAAILHYQLKSKKPPKGGFKSMLIDAAASYAGYAADITRTYSHSDTEFADLINRFDILQQRIVSQIATGMTQAELHTHSCRAVADYMVANQFATCSAEALYQADIVKTFYPHGLSHFLGLQVHDVGQPLLDDTGTHATFDSRYCRQNNRVIEVGSVFTVEPGFYFIKEKLDELRNGKVSSLINWGTVDHFAPFGGIRIEDDIYISKEGPLNLTRMAGI